MKRIINKKILAREILTVIGVVVVSLLIYFILNNISQNLIEKDRKLSQEIETLDKTKRVNYQNIENESLKKVWESFTNNSIYEGTYDDFLKDYGDYSYSEILYRLAKNNGLFTKSLNDFRVKYFTSDQAIRDAYSLWKRPANSTNISYYNFEYFYNNIIKDKEFALVSYETFLKTGYKNSFENFQKLIRNKSSIKIDPKILNKTSKLIESQQKLRNKILFDYRFSIELIVVCMIIVFYSLRFLLFIIIWSIKQLKP